MQITAAVHRQLGTRMCGVEGPGRQGRDTIQIAQHESQVDPVDYHQPDSNYDPSEWEGS